jgi:hypothetical protein
MDVESRLLSILLSFHHCFKIDNISTWQIQINAGCCAINDMFTSKARPLPIRNTSGNTELQGNLAAMILKI